MDNQKKERKELGIVIPVSQKDKPTAYDLKGSVNINGTTYRLGGYLAEASGKGKMAPGTKYYYWHRVEVQDNMSQAKPSNDATSFDPMELDK